VVITVSGLAILLFLGFILGVYVGINMETAPREIAWGIPFRLVNALGITHSSPRVAVPTIIPAPAMPKEPEQAANRTGSGGVIHDASAYHPSISIAGSCYHPNTDPPENASTHHARPTTHGASARSSNKPRDTSSRETHRKYRKRGITCPDGPGRFHHPSGVIPGAQKGARGGC